ncbi:hypothetical protein QE152_g29597 [Popillia japonica]|uniref:Transposase IS30-like HTH domain-containing protein n=1 Tax=Popillia japonica TaxID=7064 RepID=A0AAW1JH35_POPJA
MLNRDQLTESEHGQVILLRSQGMLLSAIAKQMKTTTMKRWRCTTRTTIIRYRKTGSHENRPKSGRKRKTTARDNRVVHTLCLRNRKKTLEQLAGD